MRRAVPYVFKKVLNWAVLKEVEMPWESLMAAVRLGFLRSTSDGGIAVLGDRKAVGTVSPSTRLKTRPKCGCAVQVAEYRVFWNHQHSSNPAWVYIAMMWHSECTEILASQRRGSGSSGVQCFLFAEVRAGNEQLPRHCSSGSPRAASPPKCDGSPIVPAIAKPIKRFYPTGLNRDFVKYLNSAGISSLLLKYLKYLNFSLKLC